MGVNLKILLLFLMKAYHISFLFPDNIFVTNHITISWVNVSNIKWFISLQNVWNWASYTLSSLKTEKLWEVKVFMDLCFPYLRGSDWHSLTCIHFLLWLLPCRTVWLKKWRRPLYICHFSLLFSRAKHSQVPQSFLIGLSFQTPPIILFALFCTLSILSRYILK